MDISLFISVYNFGPGLQKKKAQDLDLSQRLKCNKLILGNYHFYSVMETCYKTYLSKSTITDLK